MMKEKELCKSTLDFNANKTKGIFLVIGIVFGIVPAVIRFLIDRALDTIWLLICVGCGIVIIVFFMVIASIICKCYSKVNLVVTDKRIYGTTSLGKQVDLPIDSISAVALHGKKGISVSTASGRIIFGGIKNRTELYNSISNLLVDRQEKGNQTVQQTVQQTIQTSNADELRKYKDLLDSGIITQEEFDAKKKQLLGL